MDILKELLAQMYPQNTTVYTNAQDIMNKYLKNAASTETISRKDSDKNSNWHKNFNLYVTYPDSFNDDSNSAGNLKNLSAKLEYISKMGMNAIHILPFLDSPMIDAGFDIKDYKNVRKELGGNEVLENLLKEATKYDLTIFVDLILNHISNQHQWFQKAIQGDEKYRNYFVHSKEKPNLLRTYKDSSGVWAEYNYNENIVQTRIIFPEQVGEVPHWTQAKDGYWYYHTFYPHQLDLDWNNPDVLLEFVDIISYWASKGLSFRLDAITFAGKNIYEGITESHPNVFKILEVANYVVKSISKNSVILVETCQEIDTIKKYFGTQNRQFAQLAYNFPLMSAMWTAIVTSQTKYIWNVLDKSFENMPDWGSWVTFLRNHDELSLEYVDETIRLSINDKLVEKGLSFREGFGVSGRTASFLNEDENHILMAHFLLASLPGNPAIIYGDEIGKTNDLENMKYQTKYKRELIGDNNIQDDTRDINRGYITTADINDFKAQRIYNKISDIFNQRKAISTFLLNKPTKINAPSGILALKYQNEDQELHIYINLTDTDIIIKLDYTMDELLSINNPIVQGSTISLRSHSGIWLTKSN